MARSSYVYVILDDAFPAAGFTVKHELVTWLRRSDAPAGERRVFRMPDAGGNDPVEIPLGDLVPPDKEADA